MTLTLTEGNVTVITAPQDYLQDDLYVDLAPQVGHALYLKCEAFNFAGSIKLKAAREIIARLEASGNLTGESILIESTSGNMGIAIGMIAANKGLRFVCVTDPRCNAASMRMIRALGAEIRMIEEPDPCTGYLGSRLRYVRDLCARDPRYVWLNQYTSAGNWGAHFRLTGPAIERQFPDLDVLFVGTGTAGTLMGCARYFHDRPNPPTIVAVDSIGSVAFGQPSPRWIPGLGSSVTPPQLDRGYIDDVVMVDERATIRACRDLAARGFLFGGSTGTVVSGAVSWLDEHDPDRRLTAVALAPDLGERYLETVYNDAWTAATYPPATPPQATAAPAGSNGAGLNGAGLNGAGSSQRTLASAVVDR